MIYGMVDSSKIGKEAIVTFCHLKDLTAFITDRRTAQGIRRSVSAGRREAAL